MNRSTTRPPRPLVDRALLAPRPVHSRGARLPVLAAKLVPPSPPSDLVPRPRLQSHLGDTEWRVALLTGGPGTGKTTAAAEWLQSCTDARRAWVTLDETDDRPERFWLHVDAAVRGAAEEHVDVSSRAARRRRGGPPFAGFLDEATSLHRRLVCVLDQMDQIRDPSILADVATLVDHLPPGAQIMVTSRTDPPLPLPQWRARSWLAEIRQHDLAFSPEETRALFAAAGEDRVAADDIVRLTDHTEGWVAALRLAMLSMRGRSDARTVAENFSGRNRMVAELLVTEVLDRQPDDVQEFLLRTSILSHLDADLCNALTGRTDSHEVLTTMEKEIGFISADDERTTYRYHQLFNDLLRFELRHRHPDEHLALHRRAAEHLEARGDVADAVGHLLAIGERERAFDLAFASAFAFWDYGDIAAVSAWAGVFPREFISESVHRMLVYALALAVAERFDEAVPWLDRAMLRLAADDRPAEEDLRHADALRLMQFSTSGSGDDGIECGRRALVAADAGATLGPVGRRIRPNLARALLLVDDPEGAADALDSGPAGDEVAALVLAPAMRARVAVRRGQLDEGMRCADQSLDAAEALGLPRHLGALDALIARTGVLVERQRPDEAAESFDRMHLLLARHPDNPAHEVLTRLDDIRRGNRDGAYEDGFAIVDEARGMLGGRSRPALERILDSVEARWRIESGELTRGADLVARLSDDWPGRVVLEARLALAREQPADAIRLLTAAPARTLRDRLTTTLLLGRAHAATDGRDAAPWFARAVDLAIDEGFVLTFLEEGRLAVRHSRVAAEALATPAGARLAAALGAPTAAASTAHPSRLLLTEREGAVLRYLPSRLTNGEIARECFMSVNTVKTHLKSIYAKLGVSTRAEAIDEARRLHLL